MGIINYISNATSNIGDKLYTSESKVDDNIQTMKNTAVQYLKSTVNNSKLLKSYVQLDKPVYQQASDAYLGKVMDLYINRPIPPKLSNEPVFQM